MLREGQEMDWSAEEGGKGLTGRRNILDKGFEAEKSLAQLSN